MKLDLPDEHLPLVICALEHYYAYTRAVQRDDSRYQQAAEYFRRFTEGVSTRGPKRGRSARTRSGRR